MRTPGHKKVLSDHVVFITYFGKQTYGGSFSILVKTVGSKYIQLSGLLITCGCLNLNHHIKN